MRDFEFTKCLAGVCRWTRPLTPEFARQHDRCLVTISRVNFFGRLGGLVLFSWQIWNIVMVVPVRPDSYKRLRRLLRAVRPPSEPLGIKDRSFLTIDYTKIIREFSFRWISTMAPKPYLGSFTPSLGMNILSLLTSTGQNLSEINGRYSQIPRLTWVGRRSS